MLTFLDSLISRPGITDIVINGGEGLWFDCGSGLQRDDAWVADRHDVRKLGRELIALGGRHIDIAVPCADVRLPTGIRAHVVLDPISGSGTLISLRIPRAQPMSTQDLLEAGSLTAVQLEFLNVAVRGRKNLLISGGSGTGKTTLLGALLGEAPENERIVVIEDLAELRSSHPHMVHLEARQPNIEGAGEVTTQELLRQALRMRADRLILGECRGSELMVLLTALNTGHSGGGSTLHANSLDDVPTRLEALGHLAGLSPLALAAQAISAFDVLIHLERNEGIRRVHSIGVLDKDPSGHLSVKICHV